MEGHKDTPNVAAGTLLLDANAFGGGRLGRRALEAISSAKRRGARVCIPDLVVLELAAHDWEAVGPALEILSARGYTYEGELPDTREAFAQVTRDQLEAAGTIVLTSSPRAVREALEAQILRIPPATPKSGTGGTRISTGAVDYAAWRHAQELARDGWVCVVTSDKGLLRQCNDSQILTASSIKNGLDLMLSQGLTEEEAVKLLRRLATQWPVAQDVLNAGELVGVPTLAKDGEEEFYASVAYVTLDPRPDPIDIARVHFNTAPLFEESRGSIAFAQHHPQANQSVDQFLSDELELLPPPLRPSAGESNHDKDHLVRLERAEDRIRLLFRGEIICEVSWHERNYEVRLSTPSGETEILEGVEVEVTPLFPKIPGPIPRGFFFNCLLQAILDGDR